MFLKDDMVFVCVCLFVSLKAKDQEYISNNTKVKYSVHLFVFSTTYFVFVFDFFVLFFIGCIDDEKGQDVDHQRRACPEKLV